MKFKAKLFIGFLLAGLLILPFFVLADEGMWMPHQMRMLNLQELGLKMNPDDKCPFFEYSFRTIPGCKLQPDAHAGGQSDREIQPSLPYAK